MDDFLQRAVDGVWEGYGHDHETLQFITTFAEIFVENPVIDDQDGEWYYAHGEWLRRTGPGELEIKEGVFASVVEFAHLKAGYDRYGEPLG